MEVFRSLDLNNMEAAERTALFGMMGNVFAGRQIAPPADGRLIFTDTDEIRKANAEKALTWVREMYAKHGDEFGQTREGWLLVHRSRFKEWARQSSINLTLVLRELHRQGVVKKSHGNDGKYSFRMRNNGSLIYAVWLNREVVGLAE